MNRIERMLWEEARLSDIAWTRRRSRIATLAKAASIASIVGIVLLVASRPAPSVEDAGFPPSIVGLAIAAPAVAPDGTANVPSIASLAERGGRR